jgi:hypothetical protein
MPVPIKVGQLWRRRVEQHDGYDELVIVGLQQITEDSSEYSLRAVNGLDVVSATALSLQQAFTLVSEPTPATTGLAGESLGFWCDD